MDSTELVHILEEAGWRITHEAHGHIRMQHALPGGYLTFPHPHERLPEGTGGIILRQAGLL